MAKRLNIGKWFQLSLMGICLVISLLSTSGIGADCFKPISSPKIRPGLETPKPIYLSPEQMKKMGSPVLTSRAPMIPLKLDPSSFPKLNSLTDLPVWMEICMPSQPSGLLTMTSIPGKTVFVYDDLNRLIRAIYNQTTVSYTYDEAGNRLSRIVILSKPMGTIDFDADAKNDIAIYRVSTGQWFIIPSSTGVPYGQGWGGNSSDKPVPGDYDGDGNTDIAIYRATTGEWYIIPSSTGVAYGVGWGGSGFKPVPGDYDGDGKTDIAIYETGTGTWWIIPSSTGLAYGVGWGGDPSDRPAPGDYDGDGKTDVAIYRASTGQWYIIPSSTGVPYGVGWGLADDKPVPADYDGDGKTDIAIYRPSDGGWRIMPSGGAAPYAVGWGGSGFQPAPGDYDGDGKTDIAVYETGTGAWYIIPSSTGVPYGLNWGGDPTDIPLPGILPSTY